MVGQEVALRLERDKMSLQSLGTRLDQGPKGAGSLELAEHPVLGWQGQA